MRGPDSVGEVGIAGGAITNLISVECDLAFVDCCDKTNITSNLSKHCAIRLPDRSMASPSNDVLLWPFSSFAGNRQYARIKAP